MSNRILFSGSQGGDNEIRLDLNVDGKRYAPMPMRKADKDRLHAFQSSKIIGNDGTIEACFSLRR